MTPLHHFGSFVRDLFAAIPLAAARGLFLATLVVVLVWVIRLPKETARSSPASRWTEDLRVWAAVALAIQIAIYAMI